MRKFRGVSGGTPKGIPLCRTCRQGMYIRGASESQELLYCNGIGGLESTPLPFEAYDCNEYDDKRLPSKSDMYQTAWILRTDPKQKGTLGFFSPQQLRDLRKEGSIGPEDDD